MMIYTTNSSFTVNLLDAEKDKDNLSQFIVEVVNGNNTSLFDPDETATSNKNISYDSSNKKITIKNIPVSDGVNFITVHKKVGSGENYSIKKCVSVLVNKVTSLSSIDVSY